MTISGGILLMGQDYVLSVNVMGAVLLTFGGTD